MIYLIAMVKTSRYYLFLPLFIKQIVIKVISFKFEYLYTLIYVISFIVFVISIKEKRHHSRAMEALAVWSKSKLSYQASAVSIHI